MDKTSEKVTKDSKRQERGKKSHDTYIHKKAKGKNTRGEAAAYPFPYGKVYTLCLFLYR